MMPEKNENIIQEALSRLIWQFRKKANFTALLSTFLKHWQEGENVDYQLLDINLEDAAGKVLDIFGEIVGESRTLNLDAYSGIFVFDGNYLGDGFGDCPIIFGSRIFTFNNPVLINQYSITSSGSSAPIEWRLWASNDTLNWDMLNHQLHQVNWGSGEERIFDIDNTGLYLKYKLEILDGAPTGISIESIKLIDKDYFLNETGYTVLYETITGEDADYGSYIEDPDLPVDSIVGAEIITIDCEEPVVIDNFAINSINSSSDKTVYISASDDDINWIELEDFDNISGWNGSQNFPITHINKYKKYRIVICWLNETESQFEITPNIVSDLSRYASISDNFNIFGNLNVGGKLAGLYSKDGITVYNRDDEEYRLAIKAKIYINKTSATPEETLDFAKFMASSDLAEFWEYCDATPATCSIGFASYFEPIFYKYLRNRAKRVLPAGVKLLYITLFNDKLAFILNSVLDRLVGTFMFDDTYWDEELWCDYEINDPDGLGDVNDPSVGGELALLI